MPRIANKKNKKPLRGSVRQNTTTREPEESESWFHFELSFGMRLTLMVAAALLVIVGTAVLWRSGWPRRQYQNLIETSIDVTRKAQFSVRDIAVEGRFYTDRDMLSMAIGARSGAPMVSFDPQEALERLQQLPWVETASVERRLPDKIFIRLVERQPMARWQRDNHVSIIDTKGQEIRDASPDNFASLPLVVGPDAPQKTEELLGFLKNFAFITQNLKAAVRVGERRWDLYLNPKIIIRLPEKDVVASLMRLDQLVREKKVLEYEVATVDLRIADRMIVEPMSGTASSDPTDKTAKTPSPKESPKAKPQTPVEQPSKSLKKEQQKDLSPERKKTP